MERCFTALDLLFENHNIKMGELTQAAQENSTMWGSIDTPHPKVRKSVAGKSVATQKRQSKREKQ